MQKGLHVRNTIKLRTFVEAIFYVLKTGVQLAYIPDIYGNSRAIHKCYKY